MMNSGFTYESSYKIAMFEGHKENKSRVDPFVVVLVQYII
uniref:Uncharacterized protein n=1 Tax=Vitis vinifera TaxID=29760 RepID=F6HAA5_VITVI